VITVDEHQAGTHAQQRISRRLGEVREPRGETGQLDRGSQEGGGERI
jgi:hypothetical protein